MHNDSLGDLLSAENQYIKLYGIPLDPNNSVEVQQLANAIASGEIEGGTLTTSLGPNGDTTALSNRIVADDDKIFDIQSDNEGNTTFIDSLGDKITVSPAGAEISETLPDSAGGYVVVEFGYATDGTQFVASKTCYTASAQVVYITTNDVDANTGNLVSSQTTLYGESGQKISVSSTDGNGNPTSEYLYKSDGSYSESIYDGDSSVTQLEFDSGGNLVAQQNLTLDGAGIETEETTVGANGLDHNPEAALSNSANSSATQQLIGDIALSTNTGSLSPLFPDANAQTPIKLLDIGNADTVPSGASSSQAGSPVELSDVPLSSLDDIIASQTSPYTGPTFMPNFGGAGSGAGPIDITSPLMSSGSPSLPTQTDTATEQFDTFANELDAIYSGHIYYLVPQSDGTDMVYTTQQFEALPNNTAHATAAFLKQSDGGGTYYPLFNLFDGNQGNFASLPRRRTEDR